MSWPWPKVKVMVHMYTTLCPAYIFSRVRICVILEFIPIVQFYFSLFTACFLMSLMWRIPISSHILTRFWSLFGLCHFCCRPPPPLPRHIYDIKTTMSSVCLCTEAFNCTKKKTFPTENKLGCRFKPYFCRREKGKEQTKPSVFSLSLSLFFFFCLSKIFG